jgi:hypothetical protein
MQTMGDAEAEIRRLAEKLGEEYLNRAKGTMPAALEHKTDDWYYTFGQRQCGNGTYANWRRKQDAYEHAEWERRCAAAREHKKENLKTAVRYFIEAGLIDRADEAHRDVTGNRLPEIFEAANMKQKAADAYLHNHQFVKAVRLFREIGLTSHVVAAVREAEKRAGEKQLGQLDLAWIYEEAGMADKAAHAYLTEAEKGRVQLYENVLENLRKLNPRGIAQETAICQKLHSFFIEKGEITKAQAIEVQLGALEQMERGNKIQR